MNWSLGKKEIMTQTSRPCHPNCSLQPLCSGSMGHLQYRVAQSTSHPKYRVLLLINVSFFIPIIYYLWFILIFLVYYYNYDYHSPLPSSIRFLLNDPSRLGTCQQWTQPSHLKPGPSIRRTMTGHRLSKREICLMTSWPIVHPSNLSTGFSFGTWRFPSAPLLAHIQIGPLNDIVTGKKRGAAGRWALQIWCQVLFRRDGVRCTMIRGK